MQSTGLGPNERRRDPRDGERRRSQGGNIVPPSPALVRHGSKQRKIPAALTPGGGNTPGALTPHSASAQINVPIGSQRVGNQHPYANATTGGTYDYRREGGDDSYGATQPYGRASPMVSTVGAAPPAVSTVRARAGETGVSQGPEDGDDAPPKPSLLRILTCRCG